MSKTKVILFDVDGVLIRLPFYFSEVLEKEGYNGAKRNLDRYFQGKDNILCLENKAIAEKIIMPYLADFKWRGTSEEYFQRQFDFEKKYLDSKIISFIKKIKKSGLKCCLCTDQAKSRADFILNEMNFKDIFDAHYISSDIGCRKCHNNFWIFVIDNLNKKYSNLKMDNIIFFDDSKKNIDTASKFGIKTFLFKSPEKFEKDIADSGLML